ncbi:RNA ligase family protein [Chromobacterium phragmitis]|uniref:DNA ligase n=1 Tax=Chromobacterium phragmitis TaxID=2202141 RepID=A0A344UIT8_9NEIS|nr:RNA ligase family protein [Chromobacterium phragmitis]AXE35186.1 DNA ligase [Chromobacterium phragmitis]
MDTIIKYPRTPHLQGSRLQPGDEDRDQTPYAALLGRHIVVEEKMDGANAGLRFAGDGAMRLQSRGHYLSGGGREKHFALFKTWAAAHEARLRGLLGARYLMYGEWMHAKHTVFYDRLPHLFLEFDLYDAETGRFLSTPARRRVLAQQARSPVVSVPVLYAGPAPRRLSDLLALIRPSLAKSPAWRDALRQAARRQGLDAERALAETEASDLAEGLYIKVEEGEETVERYKWVRADFLQTMADNDSHWLSRPIVPNQLATGIDLFAEREAADWAWPGEPR